MENKVIGKWISDPTHENKPDWATKKTPKGWSDSKGGSKGSQSFVGIDKRLSNSLGFEVNVNTEERIPIILGKPTKEQNEVLKHATPEQIESLYENCKHSMRIDLVIQAKNKEDFPFPIFVEADGSQHEQNRVRNNSSENHLDRVKDFCCRLNKKGIMIRVKSNENSSKKVEFVFGELKRYYDMLPVDLSLNEKRMELQKYADAICFSYANNIEQQKYVKKIGPHKFIQIVQGNIIESVMDFDKKFSPEERKLLNIWVRDKKDLRGFVTMLKIIENEKAVTLPIVYKREYYKPYTFMEEIMEILNDLIKR